MAQILSGDAAAGAETIHEAVGLAERSPELRDELDLQTWLAVGPMFLRETGTGRTLLDEAMTRAGARGAVGALPFILNLIARDQATTDRWAVAEGTYREAIALARERSADRSVVRSGRAGVAASVPRARAGSS